MKRYLAVLSVCLVLFVAGSASACDVGVQAFGFAQPLAVQSYCAPQVQSFAVQQYAVQQFSVPVQAYSVQQFAVPVTQQVFVQNAGHHHQRQRVFAQRSSSSVVRTRTVVRSR